MLLSLSFVFYEHFFHFCSRMPVSENFEFFHSRRIDRWLREQGEKSFLQSPQKIQKKKTIAKPIRKYYYVLKRVAHILSKGTLHWKNALHLEHVVRIVANNNCNQFFCDRVSCSAIQRMGTKAGKKKNYRFNEEQR